MVDTSSQNIIDQHGGSKGTDDANAKSIAITVPEVSLPKGGGAIKSIDEKFQVNAANGTAGFSIPFPFSPSRNSFMPGMTLTYNSGSGNGVFGLGWNAEPPSIVRKTEKKLPEYNDAEESDTFIFSGAEDMVPALLKDPSGNWVKDVSTDGSIRRYKPRIEGGFARIEKISESNGNVYWKVTSKDNIVSVFGKSKSAQVFNPGDETKIFKWLLELSYDDKGNCFQCEYKKEDKINVPNALHEKNRLNDFSLCTNVYLKRVKYCNKIHFDRTTMNLADWGNFLSNMEYFLELVLDYGEHDLANPQPNDDWGWAFRSDAFSDYRAGFEIRTYRLCQRVLMFHHFKELGTQPYLVRSLNLKYDQSAAFTFLAAMSQTGYIWNADYTANTQKSLPPVEFNYEPLGWDTEIRSLSKESVENLPVGIDDKLYQWIDLYNEGISGVLTEQANAWYYKSNSGNGNLDPVKLVSPKPSFMGLNSGALHFQDVEANGQKFLVSNDFNGYYEFTPEEEWLPFKNFKEIPNIDLRDPNLKFLDLNGDGKADILISEENVFVWYASSGKGGFEDYRISGKPADEEKGPDILFADSTQSIVLADMSGDGLMDIVRVRNSEIVYWPNLGYGKFGAKASMSNAPLFDHPDHFNSNYVKLADLDGSGTTDIVYLGKDSFTIYFNQSGNSWSEENIVKGVNPIPFSKMDDHANVSIIDLLGNGTGCIVWSTPLPAYYRNPLRYIDLMGGKKPHIMTGYKNNMGKEVSIEYKPSTFFYLEDKKAGVPWVTKLPFPVQCVNKTITTDKWKQTQFSNQYSYHHGYYDYGEREFRGFGRVEQVDTETFGEFANANANSPYITADKLLYQPPVMTKSWFHTGAFLDKEKILSQFAHEYFAPASPSFNENKLPEPDLGSLDLTIEEFKEALRSCKGMTLRQEVYELDVNELDNGIFKQVKLFSTAFHNCHIQMLQPQKQNLYAVFLTTESEAITYNYELDLSVPGILPDPRIAHTLNLQTDELGNVLQAIAAVYPRIGKLVDATLPAGAEDLIRAVQQEGHLGYTVNTFTNDVVSDNDYRLRVPCQVQLYELTGLKSSVGFYFSLEELRSVASGVINEIPYQQLPDNMNLQKRMVECSRMLYFRPDLISAETFGVINALALPYETYKLALTTELLNAIIGEKLNALQQGGETYEQMLERILPAGGYHFENNAWWIRSGIAGFAEDAATHFYLPEKYTDAFDNITTLQFDPYDFFIQKSTDPLLNETEVVSFDYRVLAPTQLKDINGNFSEVVFDILGSPAALALKGKGSEGDNLTDVNTVNDENDLINFFTNVDYDVSLAQSFLGNATARYVYYLGEIIEADGSVTYANYPASAAVITREKHVTQLGAGELSPLQTAFQYSDGSGTLLAAKMQAEPSSDGGPLQWITNGKTILNNKGKSVKKYEPYFATSPAYEDPVEVGEYVIMYYDAPGRLIRTEMPDGSYSRVEFTPWFSSAYDQNDTVLEPGNAWYQAFTTSTDPAKQTAAALAAVHANTPAQIFFDSLGRNVISIAHNKWQTTDDLGIITPHEKKYLTYTKLDAEGKPLWIRDARGNRVMQYIFPFKPDDMAEGTWTANYSPCYDIAGNLLFQHSMDGGDRWMITDAAGKPFYGWDVNERQLEDNSFITEQRNYSAEYDALHRPTALWLTIAGVPKTLIGKTVYGETLLLPDRSNIATLQAINLLGQVSQHYDSGGLITNNHFDFKGNLLDAQKQLASVYKAPVIDWQDGSDTNGLEAEIFSQQTQYDALNRMTRQYNWHKTDNNIAVYEPQYNERGILQSEDIVVKANKTGTEYSGGQRTTAISNMIYDAKGQLQRIYYGNGTTTKYNYDPLTFRLLQLRTTRKDFNPAFPDDEGLKDARVLQNLYYTYDAVGNITEIYDDAYEPAFFNNQMVEPRSAYKYDALYQLIEASGRENNKLDSAPVRQEDAADNTSFPIAAKVLRNYIQQYNYDEAGNIIQMKHRAGNGSLTDRWTRHYVYETKSNRLTKTYLGSDTANAINYLYDTHGSIRNLETTDQANYLQWDYNDMISCLNCIGGGFAYYQYDATKQRNRKRVERLDGSGEERQYIGGMEWYRRKDSAGNILEEIETHHLFAGSQRVLIVEDVITAGSPGLSAGVLYRYQYINHLGSACLELNENAEIISYEEYHPYGTTSYQAINKDIQSTHKRYRYTGMERDEESGLEYHSARYYLPWLGRWLSVDPIGVKGGMNLFVYSNKNPISFIDKSGMTPDVAFDPSGVEYDKDENGTWNEADIGVEGAGEVIIVTDKAPPEDDIDKQRDAGIVQVMTRDQYEQQNVKDFYNNPYNIWTPETAAEYWKEFPEEAARAYYGQLENSYDKYYQGRASDIRNNWAVLDNEVKLGNGIGYVTTGIATAGFGGLVVAAGATGGISIGAASTVAGAAGTVESARGGQDLDTAAQIFETQGSSGNSIMVQRFCDITNPATLVSRAALTSQQVADQAASNISDPVGLEIQAAQHAAGNVFQSPLVSVGTDLNNMVSSVDPWMQTIVTGSPGFEGAARAPFIATFNVPECLLTTPNNSLSTSETELLFFGPDLLKYLVCVIPNPY
jgi:RHS repeat-associated protein